MAIKLLHPIECSAIGESGYRILLNRAGARNGTGVGILLGASGKQKHGNEWES
jgi:hypothetical protein